MSAVATTHLDAATIREGLGTRAASVRLRERNLEAIVAPPREGKIANELCSPWCFLTGSEAVTFAL